MIMSIEELLTQNKNFIYKIASKYSKYYNIDDLFQVGAIGFIKAYKNYKKPDNGCGIWLYNPCFRTGVRTGSGGTGRGFYQ